MSKPQTRTWYLLVRYSFLIYLGGWRNEDDYKLKDRLEALAIEEGIEDKVHFKLNLPIEEVVDIMAIAKAGIHTMKNEHFGIAIVEMMAAGLITIAHESGGPLRDIIQKSKTRGYLATSDLDYSDAMYTAIQFFDNKKHIQMRENARNVALTDFSDEAFMEKFKKYFVDIIYSM